MSKYIITCSPPTPNGDLHLGHLAGPFLSADICQRVLKRSGHEVIFVSYSDDYQSYVPRKAEALERDSDSYSKLMWKSMSISLELLDIIFDNFPRSKGNKFFQSSVEHYLDSISNDLEIRKTNVYFCNNCGRFGHEAYGRGKCNWCGADSDASQCEVCAKKPIPEKMTSMHCISCKEEMHLIKQKNIIWKLGKYYSKIKAHHAKYDMRPALKNYLQDVLKNTKDTWPITRPGDAGLPIKHFGNDPVHTWFMGLAGYRASVMEYLDRNTKYGEFSDWWTPNTKIISFLGYDCSYSHAVAYSVQLYCDPTGPDIGNFLTNKFLKLEGKDFSTSRGYAIWLRDISSKYPSDAIRLYIALNAPENETKNFSLTDFNQWYLDTYKRISKEMFEVFCESVNSLEISKYDEAYWSKLPLAQEYKKFSSPENFSTVGMAKAVLNLSEEISKLETKSQLPGWIYFVKLAEPFMPNLSFKFLEEKKKFDKKI